MDGVSAVGGAGAGQPGLQEEYRAELLARLRERRRQRQALLPQREPRPAKGQPRR
ncbi:hypothetical protein ACUN7V_16395 [Quadrisphaera oryzae]|uniref:hypothetical protein n=1 Tax=Quadrisphaera oryzae TaxID=2509661 RepID=UPI004044A788